MEMSQRNLRDQQQQRLNGSHIQLDLNILNGMQMPLDMSWHNPMAPFIHYGSKKSADMMRKGKWTVSFRFFHNK